MVDPFLQLTSSTAWHFDFLRPIRFAHLINANATEPSSRAAALSGCGNTGWSPEIRLRTECLAPSPLQKNRLWAILLGRDVSSCRAWEYFSSLLYGHHRGSASQRRHIAPTSRRQAAGSKFNKPALPKSTSTPQGPGRKIRSLNTLLFPRSAYSLYEVDDALQ